MVFLLPGLECGGNVRELWLNHHELACSVAGDMLDIQEYPVDRTLNRTGLVEGVLAAFDGDPEHG